MAAKYRKRDDLTGLRNTFNAGAIGLGLAGGLYVGQMLIPDADIQNVFKIAATSAAVLASSFVLTAALVIKTQGLTIFPKREPKL